MVNEALFRRVFAGLTLSPEQDQAAADFTLKLRAQFRPMNHAAPDTIEPPPYRPPSQAEELARWRRARVLPG